MRSSTKTLLCLLATLPSAYGVTLILGDTSGDTRGANALDIQVEHEYSNYVASGDNSIAIGTSNVSAGYRSIAFGSTNSSIGPDTITIGINNYVETSPTSSAPSFAIGAFNSIYADTWNNPNAPYPQCSMSLGIESWITAPYSFALGRSNGVYGQNSFSAGFDNQISAADAFVFGSGISNSVAGSMMIGPSGTAKVTILSSGNVGIGTAAPAQKLTVVGSVRVVNTTNASKYVDFSTDGNGYLSIGNTVLNGTLGAGNGYYNLHSYGPVVGTASGYFFSNGTNAVSGSQDTGLYRLAAGKISVGNSTVGNAGGTLVAGKIGIGIDTPSSALEVAGDIKTTGSFLFRGLQTGAVAKPMVLTNWYGMESLVIRHDSATNLADYKISFRNSANGNETISYGRFGVTLDLPTSTFDVVSASGQSSDVFRVSTNALKVAASGNVGIGASTPQATLQIQAPTNVDGGKALRVVDSGFPATPANSSSPAVGQVQFSPVLNSAAVVSIGRRSVGATSSGTELGTLLFNGSGTDGASFRKGATITAVTKTNDWGNSNAPTDLVISVNAGTSQMDQMAEAMRVSSDKSVKISGNVTLKNAAVIRVSPAGDIPMIANPVGTNPGL